jgi:hypothetical protein
MGISTNYGLRTVSDMAHRFAACSVIYKEEE